MIGLKNILNCPYQAREKTLLYCVRYILILFAHLKYIAGFNNFLKPREVLLSPADARLLPSPSPGSSFYGCESSGEKKEICCWRISPEHRTHFARTCDAILRTRVQTVAVTETWTRQELWKTQWLFLMSLMTEWWAWRNNQKFFTLRYDESLN